MINDGHAILTWIAEIDHLFSISCNYNRSLQRCKLSLLLFRWLLTSYYSLHDLINQQSKSAMLVAQMPPSKMHKMANLLLKEKTKKVLKKAQQVKHGKYTEAEMSNTQVRIISA